MRITLEQVETLRKKVNCDYQIAEKALRKSKGNIDAATLYLKKIENKKYKKIIEIIREIMNKLFNFNLLIFKEDKKVFNFPVVLIAIILWISNIPLPIILSIGVLAALSEFSFEIVDRNENNEYEKTDCSSNSKSSFVKEDIQPKECQKDSLHSQDVHTEETKPIIPKEQDMQKYDEDGFNEIIIE